MNKINLKQSLTFTGLIMMIFCTLYLTAMFVITYLDGLVTGNYAIVWTINKQGEASIEMVLVTIVCLVSVYAFLNVFSKSTITRQLATIIKGH